MSLCAHADSNMFGKDRGKTLPAIQLKQNLQALWLLAYKQLHQILIQVGVNMTHDTDRVPMLDIFAVIDAFQADLRGLGASTVSCPRQAPSRGVVQYTYHQWFQPFSAHRRYCELPVSGKNVKRFLQFRLGCHKLPIASGRRNGVAWACRLCTFCDAGAVGDEKYLVFGSITGQIC